MTMASYILHMVEDLSHEVITGKSDPNRKVKTGMIKMELAAKLGKTIEELDGDEGGQITGEPDGKPVIHAPFLSVEESNRRWFAEHGTHGTGGENA